METKILFAIVYKTKIRFPYFFGVTNRTQNIRPIEVI